MNKNLPPCPCPYHSGLEAQIKYDHETLEKNSKQIISIMEKTNSLIGKVAIMQAVLLVIIEFSIEYLKH